MCFIASGGFSKINKIVLLAANFCPCPNQTDIMDKKIKNLIWKKLEEVLDPEIRISVVDLGLIYEVLEENPGSIEIRMTLTTIGCPFFSLIEEEIKKKVLEIESIKKVKIELTFEPPWSPEKLSEKAKAQLSFLR